MFRNALILISAIGLAMPAAAQDKGSKLPENTIDCRQFKKSGPQEWIEVGTAVFDLGQITDINLTAQPVRPRSFKFGGIDLYPVLEGKCGAAAYFNQGKTDQAKGNVDSALANFNQAILLDPKNAEAFDLRGSLYAGKGDYARAIADYDEALRLDPKLESAASHKTGAQEALAKGSASNAPAEPQITLQEAGAVLKKGLDANGTASTPVQIPEQAHKDQALPKAEDKYASLAIPSQSGSCRAKKSIYVADGVADEKGVRSVIELVFENRQDGAVSGVNSEFVIRENPKTIKFNGLIKARPSRKIIPNTWSLHPSRSEEKGLLCWRSITSSQAAMAQVKQFCTLAGCMHYLHPKILFAP